MGKTFRKNSEDADEFKNKTKKILNSKKKKSPYNVKYKKFTEDY